MSKLIKLISSAVKRALDFAPEAAKSSRDNKAFFKPAVAFALTLTMVLGMFPQGSIEAMAEEIKSVTTSQDTSDQSQDADTSTQSTSGKINAASISNVFNYGSAVINNVGALTATSTSSVDGDVVEWAGEKVRKSSNAGATEEAKVFDYATAYSKLTYGTREWRLRFYPHALPIKNSTQGQTLSAGGTYYVDQNSSVTCSNSILGGSGLTIGGNGVTIIVGKDATLTCTGKDGDATHPGGAGINTNGYSVNFIGNGQIVATGGKGGSGTVGQAGPDAKKRDSISGAGGWTYALPAANIFGTESCVGQYKWTTSGGGNGGNGGAGAGAGIGTVGGARGGTGGAGGETEQVDTQPWHFYNAPALPIITVFDPGWYVEKTETTVVPRDAVKAAGKDGTSGDASGSFGTVKCYGSISLDGKGGDEDPNAKSSYNGAGRSLSYKSKIDFKPAYVPMGAIGGLFLDCYENAIVNGGGGSGGNGYPGSAAAGIGSGGSAGAGGGGGGSGGIRWHSKEDGDDAAYSHHNKGRDFNWGGAGIGFGQDAASGYVDIDSPRERFVSGSGAGKQYNWYDLKYDPDDIGNADKTDQPGGVAIKGGRSVVKDAGDPGKIYYGGSLLNSADGNSKYLRDGQGKTSIKEESSNLPGRYPLSECVVKFVKNGKELGTFPAAEIDQYGHYYWEYISQDKDVVPLIKVIHVPSGKTVYSTSDKFQRQHFVFSDNVKAGTTSPGNAFVTINFDKLIDDDGNEEVDGVYEDDLITTANSLTIYFPIRLNPERYEVRYDNYIQAGKETENTNFDSDESKNTGLMTVDKKNNHFSGDQSAPAFKYTGFKVTPIWNNSNKNSGDAWKKNQAYLCDKTATRDDGKTDAHLDAGGKANSDSHADDKSFRLEPGKLDGYKLKSIENNTAVGTQTAKFTFVAIDNGSDPVYQHWAYPATEDGSFRSEVTWDSNFSIVDVPTVTTKDTVIADGARMKDFDFTLEAKVNDKQTKPYSYNETRGTVHWKMQKIQKKDDGGAPIVDDKGDPVYESIPKGLEFDPETGRIYGTYSDDTDGTEFGIFTAYNLAGDSLNQVTVEWAKTPQVTAYAETTKGVPVSGVKFNLFCWDTGTEGKTEIIKQQHIADRSACGSGTTDSVGEVGITIVPEKFYPDRIKITAETIQDNSGRPQRIVIDPTTHSCTTRQIAFPKNKDNMVGYHDDGRLFLTGHEEIEPYAVVEQTIAHKFWANGHATFNGRDPEDDDASILKTFYGYNNEGDVETPTEPASNGKDYLFIQKGWRFTRWSSKSNSTDTLVVDSKYKDKGATVLNSDVNYYAQYEQCKYTVKYDVNGGVEKIPDKVLLYDSTTRVGNVVEPTRPGYIFTGWTLARDDEYKITKQTNIRDILTKPNDNETIMIKANWTIRTNISVLLDSNGTDDFPATIAGDKTKQYDMQTAGEVRDYPSPERPGWTFTGWSTKMDSNKAVGKYAPNMSIATPWLLPVYYSFDKNNDFIYRDDIHTDKGFYYDGFTPEDVANRIVGGKDVQTYYAIWKPNNISVLYDLMGGNIDGNLKSPEFMGLAHELYEIPKDPKKPGYKFMGWYYSPSNREKKVPDDQLGVFHTESEAFYAQWEPVVTTAILGANDGAVPSSQNYTGKYQTAIEYVTPVKDKYTFGGWVPLDSATGKEIPGVDPVIFLGFPGEDTSYVAVMERNKNIISYDPVGGTYPEGETGIRKGSEGDVVTPPATPIKSGYTFGGWYSTASCRDDEAVDAYTEMPDHSVTLYAKWTPRTDCQVTLTATGASQFATQTKTGTFDTVVPFDMPVKDGYAFIGWKLKGEDDEKKTMSLKFPAPNEDGTPAQYEAVWKAGARTIYFIANGGSFAENLDGSEEDGMRSGTPEEEYSVPVDPTKEGYDFMGWWSKDGSDDDDWGDEQTDLTAGSSHTVGDENKSYYAKWELKDITITFDLDNSADKPLGTVESPVPMADTITRTGKYGSAIDTTKNVADAFDIQNPVRNNPEGKQFIFVGWKTDDSDESATKDYSGLKYPSADKTYMALWRESNARVTFDANGGTINDPAAEDGVLTIKGYDGGTYIVPAVSNPGYEFLGWYNLPVDGDVSKLTQGGKGWFSAYDETYYAQWTPKTINVILKASDADDAETQELSGDYNTRVQYKVPEAVDDQGASLGAFVGWHKEGKTGDTLALMFPTEDTTYVASYDSTKTTLVFDPNGGAFTKDGAPFNKKDASGNVTKDTEDGIRIGQPATPGTSYMRPDDPEREGYKFNGWYYGEDNNYAKLLDSDPLYTKLPETSKTQIFYAHWTPDISPVQLMVDFGDGKGYVNYEKEKKGAANTPIAYEQPTREGYTFTGWTQDTTAAKGDLTPLFPVPDPELDENGNTKVAKFYATWAPMDTMVSLSLDGGSVAKGVDIIMRGKVGSILNMPALQDDAYKPTKEGYEFGGWYADEKLTQKVDPVPTTFPTKTTNYFAKWNIVSSTATLYLDEPENITDLPYEVHKDGEYDTDIDYVEPSKPGYTFKGWNKNPNQREGSLNIRYEMEDVTWYGAWEPNPVTVNFDTNDGVIKPDNISYKTIEGLVGEEYDVPVAEKPGYVFLGWYTTTSVVAGADPAIPLDATKYNFPTENTTYYAQYEERTDIKITYDLNGGWINGDSSQKGPIGPEDHKFQEQLTFPDVVKDGYNLRGWIVLGADESSVASYIECPSHDTTYQAVWKEGDLKTIYFDANGGEMLKPDDPAEPANAMVRGLEKSQYTVPNVKPRKGYTFWGWSLTPTNDTTSVVLDQSLAVQERKVPFDANDITFYYAVWSQDEVKLSLDPNGGTSFGQGGTSATEDAKIYNGLYDDIVDFDVPSRPGYTFEGWSASLEDAEHNYVDVAPADTKMMLTYGKGIAEQTGSDPVKLKAVWTGGDANILFITNHSDCKPSTTLYVGKYGIKSKVENAHPTSKGYLFQGWSATLGDTDNILELDDEDNYAFTYGVDDAIAYYANWLQNDTYVKLHENVFKDSHDEVWSYNGCEGDTVPSIVPEREGFDFVGWATTDDATSGDGAISFPAPPSDSRADATLEDQVQYSKEHPIDFYAVWKPRQVTLIFGYDTMTVNVGDKVECPDIPEKSGFVADGWYDIPFPEEGDISHRLAPEISAPVKNTTYYPHYVSNEVTVTFNATGGTFTNGSTIKDETGLYGDRINWELPTPEAEGYIFAGWTDVYETSGVLPESIANNKDIAEGNYCPAYDGSIPPTVTELTYGKDKAVDNSILYARWYRPISSTSHDGLKQIPLFYASVIFNDPLQGSNHAYNAYLPVEAGKYEYEYYKDDSQKQPDKGSKTYDSGLEDATFTAPADPAPKDGYTFLGWKDKNGRDITDSTHTGSTYKYLSSWSKDGNTYTVVYNTSPVYVATYKKHVITSILNAPDADKDEQKVQTFSNLEYGTGISYVVPERKGSEFVGWQKNSDSTADPETVIHAGDDDPSEGATESYNAIWKITDASAVFDANTGTFADGKDKVEYKTHDDGTTYKYNEQITIPVPSKENYDFIGWFTAPVTGAQVFADQSGTTFSTGNLDVGNHVYYAHYLIKPKTIMLDPNGGESKGVTAKGGVEETSGAPKYYEGSYGDFVQFAMPSRPGYTFVGWNESGTDDGSALTSINFGEAFNGAATLKAVWKGGEVAVTYYYEDPTAETGYVVKESVYGTEIDVAPATKRKGYLFNGWNSAKDGSGTSISADDLARGKMQINFGDATIYYAQWTENFTKVELEPNKGTPTDLQELSGVPDKYVPFTTVFRTGFKFMGWSEKDNIDEAVGEFAPVKTPKFPAPNDDGSAYKWYAIWDPLGITVKYDPIDGTFPVRDDGTQDGGYRDGAPGTAITLPDDPVKPGYTFKGWYLYRDGGERVTDLPTTMPDVPAVYYAHYEANPVTLYFDVNNTGSLDGTAPKFEDGSTLKVIKGSFGENVEVPAPIWDNHTFLGWSNDPEAGIGDYKLVYGRKPAIGAEEGYDPDPLKTQPGTSANTLYAVWASEPMSISFIDVDEPPAKVVSGNIGSMATVPEPVQTYGKKTLGWFDTMADTKADGSAAVNISTYGDADPSKPGQQIVLKKTLPSAFYVHRTDMTFTTSFKAPDANDIALKNQEFTGVLGVTTEPRTPKRDGYTFAGWVNCVDGDPTKADDGDEPQMLVKHGTQSRKFAEAAGGPENQKTTEVYYAKWTPKQVSVSFEINTENANEKATITQADGTDAGRAFDFKAGVDTTFDAPTAVRWGYTCTGWYTSPVSENGTKAFDAGARGVVVPTGNVIYFAHWAPMDWSITLSPNGGKLGGSSDAVTITGKYGENVSYGAPDGTGVGSFTGFNKSGSYDYDTPESVDNAFPLVSLRFGSTPVDPVPGDDMSLCVPPTADTPLLAVWDNSSARISFITNSIESESKSYKGTAIGTKDSTFTMPANPTRKGYKFVKWSKDPSGEDAAQDFPTTGLKDENDAVVVVSNPQAGEVLLVPGTTKLQYLGASDTYYAIWKQNYTHIKLHNDNDATQDSVQELDGCEGARIVYEVPEKEGFTFGGWSSTQGQTSGGIKGDGFVFPNQPADDTSAGAPGHEIEFYAVWIPTQSSITFDPLEGSFTDPAFEELIADGASDITTKVADYKPGKTRAPSRKGYVFDGWYTDPAGGKKLVDTVTDPDTETAYPSTMPLEGGIYFAHYTANMLDVNFVANGKIQGFDPEATFSATNAPNTFIYSGFKAALVSGAYGSGLSYPIPSWENHVFVGWSTSPDTKADDTANIIMRFTFGEGDCAIPDSQASTVKAYTGSGATRTINPNYKPTFYAVWRSDKKSVSFIDNESANTIDPQIGELGDTFTVPAVEDHPGLTFDGWWTQPGNSGVQLKKNGAMAKEGDTFTFMVDTPATYFAHFKRQKTKVVLHADNADDPTLRTQTLGPADVGESVIYKTPVREGYAFVGWNSEITKDSDDAFGQLYINYGGVNKGSKDDEYWACWRADAVTDFFDGNASDAILYVEKVAQGTSVTLSGAADGTYAVPDATRKGYDFLGWYTAPDDGEGAQIYDAEAPKHYGEYGVGRWGKVNQKLFAHWKAKTSTAYFKIYDEAKDPAVHPELPDTSNPYTDVAQFTGSFGDAIDTPTVASFGKVFVGWKKLGGKDEDARNGLYFEEADVTYIAVFIDDADTKIVIYNPNGGAFTNPEHDTNCDTFMGKDSDYTVPNGPSKRGYTFVGWSLNPTAKKPDQKPGDTVNFSAYEKGVTTYYAIWRANRIVVKLNPNGGNVQGDGGTLSYEGTYNQVVEYKVPALSGYAFMGWNTSGNYGDPTDLPHLTIKFLSNKTYKAVWLEATAYVTFVTYSEQTPSTTQTGVWGQQYNVPTPTRTGYTFDGWYTLPNGQGDKITGVSGGKKQFNSTQPNVYYAKWKTRPSIVHLDNNRGKGASDITETQGTEGEYIPFVNPSRTGYTFIGWSTNKNDTSGNMHIRYPAPKDGGTTFYAVWAGNEIFLNFDANGGEWKTEETGKRDQAAGSALKWIADADVPQYEGRDFGGWWTEKIGGKQYVPKGSFSPSDPDAYKKTEIPSTMPTTDTTIYAHWIAHRVQITFDGNGGKFKTDDPAVMTDTNTTEGDYGENVVYQIPRKSGSAFLGWATTKTATADDALRTLIYGEPPVLEQPGGVTLYAVWKDGVISTSFIDTLNGTSDLVQGDLNATFTVPEPPTKMDEKDWRFDGWWTEEGLNDDGTHKGTCITDLGDLDPETPGQQVEFTEDLENAYYAYWTRLTCVAYLYPNYANPNTGESMEAREYVGPAETMIEYDQPERSGWSFVGWATTPTATAADAKLDIYYDTRQLEKLTDSFYFYAIWEDNSVKQFSHTFTTDPVRGTIDFPGGVQEDAEDINTPAQPIPSDDDVDAGMGVDTAVPGKYMTDAKGQGGQWVWDSAVVPEAEQADYNVDIVFEDATHDYPTEIGLHTATVTINKTIDVPGVDDQGAPTTVQREVQMFRKSYNFRIVYPDDRDNPRTGTNTTVRYQGPVSYDSEEMEFKAPSVTAKYGYKFLGWLPSSFDGTTQTLEDALIQPGTSIMYQLGNKNAEIYTAMFEDLDVDISVKIDENIPKENTETDENGIAKAQMPKIFASNTSSSPEEFAKDDSRDITNQGADGDDDSGDDATLEDPGYFYDESWNDDGTAIVKGYWEWDSDIIPEADQSKYTVTITYTDEDGNTTADYPSTVGATYTVNVKLTCSDTSDPYHNWEGEFSLTILDPNEPPEPPELPNPGSFDSEEQAWVWDDEVVSPADQAKYSVKIEYSNETLEPTTTKPTAYGEYDVIITLTGSGLPYDQWSTTVEKGFIIEDLRPRYSVNLVSGQEYQGGKWSIDKDSDLLEGDTVTYTLELNDSRLYMLEDNVPQIYYITTDDEGNQVDVNVPFDKIFETGYKPATIKYSFKMPAHDINVGGRIVDVPEPEPEYTLQWYRGKAGEPVRYDVPRKLGWAFIGWTFKDKNGNYPFKELDENGHRINEPDIDPRTGEQRIDPETGELVFREKDKIFVSFIMDEQYDQGTLTAQWMRADNGMSAIFFGNGGKLHDANGDAVDGLPVLGAIGDEIKVPKDPVRPGYEFTGWVDINGKKVEWPQTYDVQTTCYYATWKQLTTGVILDPNGGSGGGTLKGLSGDMVDYTSMIPERGDDIFLGWAETPGAAAGKFNITFPLEGTKKYYATWGSRKRAQVVRGKTINPDMLTQAFDGNFANITLPNGVKIPTNPDGTIPDWLENYLENYDVKLGGLRLVFNVTGGQIIYEQLPNGTAKYTVLANMFYNIDSITIDGVDYRLDGAEYTNKTADDTSDDGIALKDSFVGEHLMVAKFKAPFPWWIIVIAALAGSLIVSTAYFLLKRKRDDDDPDGDGPDGDGSAGGPDAGNGPDGGVLAGSGSVGSSGVGAGAAVVGASAPVVPVATVPAPAGVSAPMPAAPTPEPTAPSVPSAAGSTDAPVSNAGSGPAAVSSPVETPESEVSSVWSKPQE